MKSRNAYADIVTIKGSRKKVAYKSPKQNEVTLRRWEDSKSKRDMIINLDPEKDGEWIRSNHGRTRIKYHHLMWLIRRKESKKNRNSKGKRKHPDKNEHRRRNAEYMKNRLETEQNKAAVDKDDIAARLH